MLVGVDPERRIIVAGLLAALSAAALACGYLYLIYSQDANGLAAPRVHFVFAFTVGLGLACLAGALLPRSPFRVALLSCATVGLMLMILLAAASIGLLYLVPAICAVFTTERVVALQEDARTPIAGIAGAAAALVTLAVGLSAFPTG